jgi:hypothetical protein
MTEEAPSVGPVTRAEAESWRGCRLDEIGGARIGRVQGLFVDAEDDQPSWLIARLGRFRGPLVAIPVADCAGGGGRVWAAHERRTIHTAPVVDASRPLLREHELTIGTHFGIEADQGRAAAVADREAGALTSKPS